MEHEIHNRMGQSGGDKRRYYYEGYEDDKNMINDKPTNPHVLPDSIVRLMSKDEQKDHLRTLDILRLLGNYIHNAPDDVVWDWSRILGIQEHHNHWFDDEWPEKKDELRGQIVEELYQRIKEKP